MKKVIKTLLSITIMLIILISSVDASASSFRRRRKKEPKGDAIYGKDWSSMDRDLDRAVNGYAQRGPSRRNDPNRSGYRRNPNPQR